MIHKLEQPKPEGMKMDGDHISETDISQPQLNDV